MLIIWFISINIFKPGKPDGNGKIFDDYWGPSVKMLQDTKFLDSLKQYDKDNIPAATIKKIRDKYVPMANFNAKGLWRID